MNYDCATTDANGNILLRNLRESFPETLFPAAGPNADWYVQMGVYPVRTCAYDPATQWPQPCDPYIQDGVVYVTRAALLPAGNLTAPG